MIKINLASSPKPKRGGKRAATATTMVEMGGGEGMSPLVIILIFVVAAVAYLGYSYWHESTRATDIATRMQQAEQENRRLAAVKAKYDQEQRVKENYQQRVNVIDSLRANQSGPVNLLTMIGDTVNATDAVWLNSLQDNGNNININGSALSANAVANLIKNLQKTGFFKSVEMSDTEQDTSSKDIQSFTFKITCEKQKS